MFNNYESIKIMWNAIKKFVQIDYVLKIATRENFMLALNIDEYHYTHVLEHIKPMEKLVLSRMHQPVQPKSLRWWGKVGNSHILQHSPSRASSPRPHKWILEWAVIILINAPARTRTRDLWPWYHIELHAPTSSTQKLKLMRKGGCWRLIVISKFV
jgi:hypothetical protein